MKIVLYPAIDEDRFVRVHKAAAGALVVNAASEEEALRLMPDADGFFGKLTPELLAAAKKLRWVQTPTASLEHYIFPELERHPCVLTNMRGLYSDVIADHVFAYILCFARNLLTYLRNQQRHTWEPIGGEAERSNFISGPGTVSAIDRSHLHLADCTLGVFGLGHIGREIARRGLAFGMRVLAVDVQPVEAPEGVEGPWPLEGLPDLLAQSDFVAIAAPHTPVTEGLFDRERLRQMRPSSYLINIGRGAIVRLDDLVCALQRGEIAGAALDVFEQEPLPPDHPLWDLPNVILTPHVAAASPRIAERHLATLLENVGRFVRGEPLINVADKSQWF